MPELIDWELQRKMAGALRDRKFLLVHNGARFEEVGNSVICCSHALSLEFVLSFSEFRKVLLGINFVAIDGPMAEEPLHFHIADIIGIVVSGSGRFIWIDSDGIQRQVSVVAGDLFILPKGVLHSFDAEIGEKSQYAVVEIGDSIDYQKHHHEIADGGQ